MPEWIDLGGGDLTTLLNQDILVRPDDQLFLVASTDGNGIDIFGVAQGYSGSVDTIDLTNGLLVLTEQRIRGDLFDATGQPL
jgi:hypothetical protein